MRIPVDVVDDIYKSSRDLRALVTTMPLLRVPETLIRPGNALGLDFCFEALLAT